ncbi:MAG: AMP-binding protein, partial [Syntrophobacteraceae bacterium]
MESRPWQRHYDYNVPLTIRYPRIPLHNLLDIPAVNFPDKAAYHFYGTQMTFRELRRSVWRMAHALAGLGVRKGDRVGINLPNCPQYLIAYYATLCLGAVVVNLNPMYTAAELKHTAEKTGMSTLITFDLVLPVIRLLCR